MTTASGRALARYAAVLLLVAIFVSWLVVNTKLSGADDSEDFSLTASSADPALTLSPEEGGPGTVFKVAGSGYSPCLDYSECLVVLWGSQKIGAAVIDVNGTFEVDVSVPQTATPGGHQVVGRADLGAEDGTESAEATFTVRASPALALSPKEGSPGTVFKVAGSGYSTCVEDSECPQVDVFWDANQKIGTVVMGYNGAFSVDVSVPQTATSGDHQVVGKFRAESAQTIFAVLPLPVMALPAAPLAGPPVPPGQPIPSSAQPLPPGPPSAQPVPPAPPASPAPPAPPSAQQAPPIPPVSPAPQVQLTPPEAPSISASAPAESVKRAYLAAQVSSPIDVFGNQLLPLQLLLSGLLVLLLVLVVAFPAVVAESTFQKNREEINGWFNWIPRPPRLNLPSWAYLNFLGIVAAVLLLMAVVPQTEVGLNEATLAQAVGYLLAIPLVAVILEMPGGLYSRWKHTGSARRKQHKRREPQWRVLPSALILAGFLALLSRLAEFSPPYVYGLIAIYIGTNRALKNLNEREKKEEKGRQTLIGILSLFAVSVISWFVWVPLDHALHQGLMGFWWLALDAFLATFFLLGLETAVFGMMPLAFLKGQEIWQWKPAVWIAVFLLIAFVFINVQLVTGVGEAVDLAMQETILAKMIKAAVLFAVFGILSFAFWGYFQPRVRQWASRVHQQFVRLVHQ